MKTPQMIGVLGVVGLFVAILIAAAVFDPPEGVTAAPKAHLGSPERVSLAPAPFGFLPEAKAALFTGQAHSSKAISAPATAVISPKDLATIDGISGTFAKLGYDLDRVRFDGVRVPRLFVATLPQGLDTVREVKVRKALFFKTVLPLILKVNEEILADRQRLWRLRSQKNLGKTFAAEDRLWLLVTGERYGVDPENLKGLLERVDVVSPSLALAQAASESGWGQSRFAREGNAMFGEWTFSTTAGIAPLKREAGKTHRVRSFNSLRDSIRAYVHNLNTHRAYREFRDSRAQMRREGGPLDGIVLAGTLTRYSERGMDYVYDIRDIIQINRLRHLDDARLSNADIPALQSLI
ncbi:MAG: glucosaminidase domain-containing protein [Rhodospirillales bacterium]|nr:glucosaminidase domain-containing protein [Rhodospirillales bacterium]